MILLLDIGNSRIKWACLDNDELHSHGSSPHQGEVCVETGIWGELPTPDGVYCASVAAEPLNRWIEDQVRERWGLPLQMLQSNARCGGVVNAYQAPESLGVDRWAALIGARQLCSTPLCVIDCGSAVTVDALDGEGKHQGGLIIPGLQLQQTLLRQGTAAITTLTERHNDEKWGRDTATCLSRGSVEAVAGLIERCRRKLIDEYGEPITVLVCGGDAQAVIPLLGFTPRHEAHLVLLGMARMIREQGE